MTREEQINDKARELAKKFFPDGENIEAIKVKLACLEMAKYLQEERWISVEDELPELYDVYLVATVGNTIEMALYDINGWHNEGLGKVSYWMPLPNPPKKTDTLTFDEKCERYKKIFEKWDELSFEEKRNRINNFRCGF